MKKDFKKQIKEYYDNHLKNIIYFLFLLIFTCIVYVIIQKDEDKLSVEEEAEKHVTAAKNYLKEASIKTVSNNRLNDMIVQNFLRELVGNENTMLFSFFPEETFKDATSNMTEVELMDYAKSVVERIKDNMEITSALVIKNEVINDKQNRYVIDIYLQSDLEVKVKTITLKVKEGTILTDINELF